MIKSTILIIIFASILIFGGIKTIITKEINGGKINIYLGDYAYVYGSVFILIGMLFLYSLYKK